MGYIVHEFALGLFALDFSKEQLMTHLATKMREVGLDELSVVNAGLGKSNSKAWSDFGLMAGRQAHPKLIEAEVQELQALRPYRLGLGPRGPSQPG